MLFPMCQGDDGEVGPRGLPGEPVSSNLRTHTHTHSVHRRETKRDLLLCTVLNIVMRLWTNPKPMEIQDLNSLNCTEWQRAGLYAAYSRAERNPGGRFTHCSAPGASAVDSAVTNIVSICTVIQQSPLSHHCQIYPKQSRHPTLHRESPLNYTKHMCSWICLATKHVYLFLKHLFGQK